MKKSPWFAALILFLAVLAAACSDDGPPEPATTGGDPDATVEADTDEDEQSASDS
ncbi:MAG: hypothetical protein IH940_12415 [Acidobacteria bacterium]|nr:hypothetical protein [Acidobacteriota bacterium]